MSKRVVALGGDGVGPEVINATCYILEKCGFDLDIIKPPCGEAALKELGNAFPEETVRQCQEACAILFGAAGTASGIIVVYLRWILDNYANVRPVKYYEGAQSPLRDPVGIDFVIVRENSEGLYPPREGDLSVLAEGLPHYKDLISGKTFAQMGEGKYAIRIITNEGAKRIARFACEHTAQRLELGYPGILTCVTKSNVLMQSCGLFERSTQEEIKRFPQLRYEHYYVDDMARRMIRYPKALDVIVTSNEFGDILSDEAAELVGGLGIAPSGCFGGKIPYFEPVHGSAPKYAGKNVINPTATILSAKMMLDYLQMKNEASALEKAVAKVYKEGKALTYDQGGNATTTQFAEAVLRKIS